MTPSEILMAAAQRIEEKGWNQGGYCPVDQSMVHTNVADIRETDAVGAIRCAVGGHFNHANDEAAAIAKEALRVVIGGGSIGAWNDDESRTKESVIAALHEAAKLCETDPPKPVYAFPWPVLRFS